MYSILRRTNRTTVIKATDIYGTWMSVYFGIFSAVLIKYTLVDLYTSVVSRRIVLQRERY